jgi:hypothetical protein
MPDAELRITLFSRGPSLSHAVTPASSPTQRDQVTVVASYPLWFSGAREHTVSCHPPAFRWREETEDEVFR